MAACGHPRAAHVRPAGRLMSRPEKKNFKRSGRSVPGTKLSGHGNVTIVMSSRTVPASRFKAECLSMLDEVAATGEEILVTKRGRAVARVVAASEPADLRGSVTFNVDDDELLKPVDSSWDAEER
jgi:prevent-host-death family protein